MSRPLQTMADIRKHLALKGQWDDPTFTETLDSAIREVYRQILNSHEWPGIHNTDTFTSTAGSQSFGLNNDVAKVIKIMDTTDGSELSGVSASELVCRYGDPVAETGTPSVWAEIGSRGVRSQPSVASLLNVSSSNAGDVSVPVRIEGVSSGSLTKETVLLNGTIDVSTASLFSEVIRIAKAQPTLGAVSVSESITALGVISAPQNTVDYPWLRFDRSPGIARSYRIFYRRAVPDLVDDNDTPWLPECGHVIVSGAFAEVLKAQRQFEKAAIQSGKFRSVLEDYRSSTISTGVSMQITPDHRWIASR